MPKNETTGGADFKKNNTTAKTSKKIDNNFFEELNIFPILAYIPLIGWILPLFLKKEDKAAQFHGKQGFILSALALLIGISGIILYAEIFKYILIVSYFVFFIGAFIYGAYAAYKNNNTEIPGIGYIAKQLFNKFEI